MWHLHVSDKIRFEEEKQRYTVQACNARFAICTKPFNLKKTVMYTIVDLDENIRGTENLVFGLGAETKKQCKEMLERLTNEKSKTCNFKTEVSHRNRIPLDIAAIYGVSKSKKRKSNE